MTTIIKTYKHFIMIPYMNKELSIIPALLVIINNMLGSGINYMPAAFMNSGYIFSWVFLFGISILTALSIFSLFISAKNYGQNASYSELGTKFSVKLKYLVRFCQMLSSILISIAFQRYITNLVLALVPSSLKTNFELYYMELIITLSMSIILGLISQIKNIADLKIFSYISVACVVSLLSLLLFSNIYLSEYIQSLNPTINDKHNYPFSVSFFIFTLCCQTNIVDLYSSLKNKRIIGLLLISIFAPFFGFLINGFAGFLGYRLIGNYIGEQDIIKVFADDVSHINLYVEKYCIYLWYAFKVQSLFAVVVLICGFLLQIAPSINIIREFCRQKNYFGKYVHQVVATSIVSVITGFNCIPKIDPGKVLAISSILCDNFISFLFPFIFLMIHKKSKSNILLCLLLLFTLPSILIFIIGILDKFMDINSIINVTKNSTILN